MILLFTAINNQTELRSFSYRPNDLEMGLDFLNLVQANGDVILSIHLIDENGVVELPTEVIDGSSFESPIRALEQEWQTLLNEEESSPFSINQELIDWNLRRIDCCEKKLANQVLMVDRLELLLLRAERNLIYEPERSRLINHYKLLIDNFNQQIVDSQSRRFRLSRRLKELLA